MTSKINIHGSLLARNVFINFIGQVVPLLVGIAALPFIIKGLGTERFGVLALAWAVVGYFSIFNLGLGRATVKFVAEALGNGEIEKLPHIVWTTVALQGIMGVLGTFILVIITPLLVERILNIPPYLLGETKRTFYLLALSVPIILISTSLRGVLEAAQRFDLVNAIKIPSSTATFLLPLVGVLLGFSLPSIVALLVAARGSTLLAFFALCLRTFPILKEKFATNKSVMSPLLTFGGWVTVSSVVGPILVYLDRFLIGALLTISAVAYYTAPYEVVTRLWIIPASLMVTLFPAFSALGGIGDRAKLENLFARSVKYLLLIMGPIIIILIVFAKEIIGTWLGSDFSEQSTRVFQILAIGVLVNSLANIPYSILQGLGRPDITAKFHLIELPLHITFLWFFVNWWGITGAAIAWTIRVSLDALLLIVASYKIYHLATPSMFVENGIVRAIVAISVFSVVTYAAGKFFVNLPTQITIIVLIMIPFTWILWRYVLDATDKNLIISLIFSRIYRRIQYEDK